MSVKRIRGRRLLDFDLLFPLQETGEMATMKGECADLLENG
jgi:hypothetical protein